MHPALKQIPARILQLAKGALTQANTHAVYQDPGNEHWDTMSILNAAHAGELFIKAVIAQEHPLLLFSDVFNLDDKTSKSLTIDDLVKRGKTHTFEKLPQVLWVATGQRIPDMACYERLRKARNAIQHFCQPDNQDLRSLSLEFIYKIVDPLIAKNFGLHAIEYHEDHIGYDYVVAQIFRSGLKFTMPNNFDVLEIDIAEELEKTSRRYRAWVKKELKRIGKPGLYD